MERHDSSVLAHAVRYSARRCRLRPRTDRFGAVDEMARTAGVRGCARFSSSQVAAGGEAPRSVSGLGCCLVPG